MSSEPSLFNYVLGFLAVGIAWGFTTPFMRKATIGYESPSRPELEDESKSIIGRKALSIWYSVYDLVSRPAYSVPLLLNLSGSVWFFLLVGQAELSLTVPITNSLAFLFTVLGEWWAEGKTITRDTWIGMSLVLSGITLCVYTPSTHMPNNGGPRIQPPIPGYDALSSFTSLVDTSFLPFTMTTQQVLGTAEKPLDLSSYGLSAEEIKTLSEKCIEAKERAYCPYSHFKVGAALLPKAANSPIVIGANVENAAYPVGTCAERVALGTAVVQGYKLGDFKALAVATNTPAGEPASPCGMCRQFIREFCEPGMPIIMHDREGTYVVKTLEELLPMSFGPDKLPTPEEMQRLEGKK